MASARFIALVVFFLGASALPTTADEQKALETFDGTTELRAAGDRRVLVAIDVRDARGALDGRAEQLFLVSCRESARLTDISGRFESHIEYNGYLGSLRVIRRDGETAVATALFSIGNRETIEAATQGCGNAAGVSRVGVGTKLVTLDDVARSRPVEECASAPGSCWEIAGSRFVFPE